MLNLLICGLILLLKLEPNGVLRGFENESRARALNLYPDMRIASQIVHGSGPYSIWNFSMR